MDDIDYEDLVVALRRIVDVFEEEIAPYAESLCQKLSEAFNRLIQQKGGQENQDEMDAETGIHTERLMTAIRRVLQSISGKLPELYPTLEAILEQSIYLCFVDSGADNVEEGITCVTELIYNQKGISERMWRLYYHIVELYLNDAGIIEDYIPATCVPLVNFMIKSPVEFKSTNFGGKGTPLDLLFKFIQKIFKDGAELEDEIHSMNAVALIIGVLEHLGEGQSQYLHTINEYYVSEIQKAETKNYKYMLIQGLMMNFNYD